MLSSTSALAPLFTNNNNSFGNNKPNAIVHTSLDDLCKGRPVDYAAPEPGSKCRRYFRCTASSSTSVYLCPGKTLFNGDKCVNPTEFICINDTLAARTKELLMGPKDCHGLADGYYQDGESGCRSYFYCSNGHKAVYVCSGISVFDGKTCVDPNSYQCPFSTSPDCHQPSSLNNNHGVGYYRADVSSGCRSYFYCSGDGHKLVTLTCSEDRLFDGKRCVEPSHYICSGNSSSLDTLDQPSESYYAYSPALDSSANEKKQNEGSPLYTP